MTRIITNENFWTMNERELTACIKAYKRNDKNSQWHTDDSHFDCQREYSNFMRKYHDYLDICEESEGIEPVFVTIFYCRLVVCM